jgi:mersacidin/lichenicidin family type 2 lantibiotic
MTHHQVIRAWKNPEYQSKPSKAERELLPAHPVGLIELLDDEFTRRPTTFTTRTAWEVIAGGLM